MDLSFTPAEERWRQELRSWLQQHLPAGWGTPEFDEPDTLEEEVAFLKSWQRRLYEGGWVGIHWPGEYGGRGASVVENFIFNEEMARARAPEVIGRIGINLVGPTLIAHGSPAQQQRYLPHILTGEELWCQLFSEPNAGSDLAAVQTRAELRGDEFVVSGQKVWTSYAQFARWGILLARTNPGAPKHHGISFLIVDMHSPGIVVRPLRQMTGSWEFNEVFLEAVRIPRENLVGELHRGWEVALTTLAHERGTSPRQMVIHRMLLDELVKRARDTGRDGQLAAGDLLVRQKLAQSYTEVEILKLHNYRTLTRLLRGEAPGAESSVIKLFWSEMSQRLHDLAMELLGPYGQLMQGSKWSVSKGKLPRSYLYYRAGTIFAGTSEIQRNIIAQRILGLPRERKAKGAFSRR